MPRSKIVPPFGVSLREVVKRRVLRWYELLYEAQDKYKQEISSKPELYGTEKVSKDVSMPSLQRQRGGQCS